MIRDTRRYLTDFDPARPGHLFPDVLVVGKGIAGAWAAITAARHGQVIVVTKASAEDTNTHQAQGGVAVAAGQDDSPDRRAVCA